MAKKPAQKVEKPAQSEIQPVKEKSGSQESDYANHPKFAKFLKKGAE